jgi:hypothetical protein
MLRLSRALVIHELELLVDASPARIDRREWKARGLDCRRERHSHSAPSYSFDLDVLIVRANSSEDGRWELFIVTEFWRSGGGTNLHSPKWLKLVAGKPAEVLRWIRKHRETDRAGGGKRDG